jgi:hypothetical protein
MLGVLFAPFLQDGAAIRGLSPAPVAELNGLLRHSHFPAVEVVLKKASSNQASGTIAFFIPWVSLAVPAFGTRICALDSSERPRTMPALPGAIRAPPIVRL